MPKGLTIRHQRSVLRLNARNNTVYLQLQSNNNGPITIALTIPEALALASYIRSRALASLDGLVIGRRPSRGGPAPRQED